MPRSHVFYSIDTKEKVNKYMPDDLTYKESLPLTDDTWTFDEESTAVRLKAVDQSVSRITKIFPTAKLGDIVSVSCEVYNISGARAKIAVGFYEKHSKYSHQWEQLSMKHVITSGADRDTVFVGLWKDETGEVIIKNIKIELLSQVEQQNIVESVYEVDSGYTKFADGTMVCFGKISASGVANQQWGNMYYVDVPSVSYPQKFSEPPIVVVSGGNQQSGLINSYYNSLSDNRSENTPRVNFIKPVIDEENKLYETNYIAWGKYDL